MRTRIALLLDGAVTLGLVLRAVAPADETRIAQATGPASPSWQRTAASSSRPGS